MKTIFIVFSLSLWGSLSLASDKFYLCEGFSGVYEYRAGINLNSNKAGFFDNDTTSYLNLTDSYQLKMAPPQTVMIFEGKDASTMGSLKLIFNLTKKEAQLLSVGKDRKIEDMSTVPCKVSNQNWDDLD